MHNKIWDEIITSLEGTCESLYAVLDYYEQRHLEDSTEFLRYLDDHIFECSSCNWWFCVSEESGISESELICVNCAEAYGE